MRRERRVRAFSIAGATAMLLVACGPSEEERFEVALASARTALEEDDLVAAESFLEDARKLRPAAAELAQAFSQLAVISDSADLYRSAEELALSAQMLEARQLYLRVQPEDVARYELAQERARSIERDWVEDAETLIERRILRGDLEQALLSVREVQRVLTDSAVLAESIERLVDPLVDLAIEVSREHLREEDLGAAELALRNVSSVLRSDDPSVIARIESVRQDIGDARERRDRERREAALARQRGGDSPGAPRPTAPIVPPVQLPQTVPGPDGRECPSPAVDVDGWRECVFGDDPSPGINVPGPGIPQTVPGPDGRECPSPAVDVEGWRECVFGGRPDIVVPPPSSGPVAPAVPDASQLEAEREAAREADREAARAQRILVLRSAEERLLREYQQLWAEQNAAQIDYQRRIRDFDAEINRLLDAGETGASAIETMRKRQFIQEDQARRRLRASRIEAVERELAAVRAELERIS